MTRKTNNGPVWQFTAPSGEGWGLRLDLPEGVPQQWKDAPSEDLILPQLPKYKEDIIDNLALMESKRTFWDKIKDVFS